MNLVITNGRGMIMSKIKQIESILLSQINFDKNEDVYDSYQKSNTESSLIAELNAKIEKMGFHEPDDNRYRAVLSLSGTIKVHQNDDSENENDPVLAEVLIAYHLNFETASTLYDENSSQPVLDENLSNELRVVIEPYYRESLQSLFNRSALEMPPLPYEMRSNKNE